VTTDEPGYTPTLSASAKPSATEPEIVGIWKMD
jgi:hypothetical protein